MLLFDTSPAQPATADLACTLVGDPVGKARPRVTKHGTFMPKRYQRWKREAKRRLSKAWGDREALRFAEVHIEIVIRRPKRLIPREQGGTLSKAGWLRERESPERCGAKPDLDNAVGAVLDALQEAGVLEDDKQVDELVSSKRYAGIDELAHVEVLVWGPR